MAKEPLVEQRLVAWLRSGGWDECKGTAYGVDRCAERAGARWLIEAKGDQENERALRNSLLTGMGQVLCAISQCQSAARYSLAVSPDYVPLLQVRFLNWHGIPGINFSVLVVFDDGRIEERWPVGAGRTIAAASGRFVPAGSVASDPSPAPFWRSIIAPGDSQHLRLSHPLSRSHPGRGVAGQGHPDGRYQVAGMEYHVEGGRLAGAHDPRTSQRLQPCSFAALCRELGLEVGADSAARVLNQYRLRTAAQQAD